MQGHLLQPQIQLYNIASDCNKATERRDPTFDCYIFNKILYGNAVMDSLYMTYVIFTVHAVQCHRCMPYMFKQGA